MTADLTVADILKTAQKFNFDGSVISAETFGCGHINDTYLIKTTGTKSCFILQRINHHVFTAPLEMVSNIEKITAHLIRKIAEEGGDPSRETLNFVQTKQGGSIYIDEDGNCFRAYDYIRGAVTYQAAGDPMLFYNSGRAFGKFQRRLGDFDVSLLYETLPRFHDTRKRYDDLMAAVAQDKMSRAEECAGEIGFVRQRRDMCSVLTDLKNAGKIPQRVTHNDTKLNNVMFDEKTGEGICVIDLDTVMPGLSLYDFGDSIRFGANAAAEDETDLSKVSLDLTLFEAYTKGYLEEAGVSLNDTEKEYLPFSAILITLECGIRFLTDYLEGDVYFKISREKHNLDRCRTQFRLVEDMESKLGEMKRIVAKYS